MSDGRQWNFVVMLIDLPLPLAAAAAAAFFAAAASFSALLSFAFALPPFAAAASPSPAALFSPTAGPPAMSSSANFLAAARRGALPAGVRMACFRRSASLELVSHTMRISGSSSWLSSEAKTHRNAIGA